LKLMLVARRFPPDVRSGTETVFEALWNQAKQRHETRLVVGYVHDRALIPSEALGVDLRHQRFGRSYTRMWRAAAQEARRFRPDAVLANSIEVPITRAPTACIIHDLNFGKSDPERTIGTLVREWVYRLRAGRLDAVVAPSRATRDALVGIGLDPARVHVIHNGVDLARFCPPDAAIFAKKSPIVQLSYPGRILPGKGQHVAIDAVARLSPAEKARVNLWIVGTVADPVYHEQLRVQARGQPVEFHTEVDDIAAYYRAADLVLFPTLMREGFGFTAIEGMACGRPVVWTDQPAIREATGGRGYPVPPNDAPAIRDVIRRFLDDPSEFRRTGAEGRAFVEGRYAWERVWDAYEAVLNGILR
jgi:glycosyltransferase involved in cell wall biosynthesis